MSRTLIAIALLITTVLLAGCARSGAGEWTPEKLKALPEANLLVPGSEVVQRHENTGKGFVPESAGISVVARTSATPAEIELYFDDQLQKRGWTKLGLAAIWKKGTLTFTVDVGPGQVIEAGTYRATLEGTEKSK